MKQAGHQMLIGGEWRDSTSKRRLESINPATEKAIATFPDADAEDVDHAVEAARAGFAAWSKLSWDKRAELLRELAQRMRERTAFFAELDAVESGLPISSMRSDAAKAPGRVLYFAGLASEIKGQTFAAPESTLCYTVREPFGIAARIVPFNHPYLFAAKVASALAAGNAVILKPAETTSLSALELGRLTIDLLPPGVLNVVTGLGRSTGQAIVAHPEIRRISFTGGLASGQAVLRDSAPYFKHVTLELGGKNPMIVFADVDVAGAADACVASNHMSRTMGQSCQAASRVFVHERIYEPFLERLVERMNALVVGDPMAEATEIGPLNSAVHHQRVLGFIRAGRDEGARLLAGGGRPNGFATGYYVEPTVFADVGDEMTIAKEEIFGPVICVSKWRELDEVIKRANATKYGLAANVWTKDLAVATRTARALRAGYVWINGTGARVECSPYGGSKLSGLGKEGDLSELVSFTEEKCIQTQL